MLSLNNVSKVFDAGTVNEKYAVKNLSATFAKGDFVTIIGANGAGKSSILNLIAGVYLPEEGTITLDGADITRIPEYRRADRISRVFQDPMVGTASDMWLEENLALAYRRGKRRGLRWGITETEREFFIEKLRPLGLGLEKRLSVKTGLLSGGQRQALTLLMASFNNPSLLLLDEHTAALDPGTAGKVLELTEQIIAENELTTLMVTHNMKDAIAYGNRLIMLSAGNILLDISGQEKQHLTVTDLMQRFADLSGEELDNDELLLTS